MDINAWDEIVRNDVNNVLQGTATAVNDTTRSRPWPPVMIRDFMDHANLSIRDVDADCAVGDIADYLAEAPGLAIAVYDDEHNFLGVGVDEDVMALIKRDGVRALDYPISEAVQRRRPVCSVTDSPHVVLQMMRSQGWDRVGVGKHGRVIGVLHRRDLAKFADA